MKAYFTASISHRKESLKDYVDIIPILKKMDIKVEYFEELFNTPLEYSIEEMKSGISKWRATWTKSIQNCDFAVVEISYPSTINVEFEIGSIIKHEKPVLGLYRKEEEPISLERGGLPRKFINSSYTVDTLKDVLSWGIGEIKEIINKRFTFLIPSDMSLFLEEFYKKTILRHRILFVI
jgi:hypothetical protein